MDIEKLIDRVDDRERRRITSRINTTCLEPIRFLQDELRHYGSHMTAKQRAAVRSAIHALQALETITR